MGWEKKGEKGERKEKNQKGARRAGLRSSSRLTLIFFEEEGKGITRLTDKPKDEQQKVQPPQKFFSSHFVPGGGGGGTVLGLNQ